MNRFLALQDLYFKFQSKCYHFGIPVNPVNGFRNNNRVKAFIIPYEPEQTNERLVAQKMHQGADPDEVVILFNHNKGESWKKQVLTQTGSHGLRVDDVNGDNALDILAPAWDNIKSFSILRNDARQNE